MSAELRVMSFNIRYGTAEDAANHWSTRRELVVQAIRRYAAVTTSPLDTISVFAVTGRGLIGFSIPAGSRPSRRISIAGKWTGGLPPITTP